METAHVLPVWLNYRFWDKFASSAKLSATELNAGAGMTLCYFESDFQQNLQAGHSIKKFFNQSLNCFLCNSKQPSTITF